MCIVKKYTRKTWETESNIMGLIFSIGVVWLTYQIINSINVVTVSKKPRTRLRIYKKSDINAA